jgi:hypothetical protein
LTQSLLKVPLLPALGGAPPHCRETEPFVLTCVQGAAIVRESAPDPTEIATMGATRIAANAPPQIVRRTERLPIAIFKSLPDPRYAQSGRSAPTSPDSVKHSARHSSRMTPVPVVGALPSNADVLAHEVDVPNAHREGFPARQTGEGAHRDELRRTTVRCPRSPASRLRRHRGLECRRAHCTVLLYLRTCSNRSCCPQPLTGVWQTVKPGVRRIRRTGGIRHKSVHSPSFGIQMDFATGSPLTSIQLAVRRVGTPSSRQRAQQDHGRTGAQQAIVRGRYRW